MVCNMGASLYEPINVYKLVAPNIGMRLPLLLQRQKADAAIRKICSWQPQRILLSHGRCFDADAEKVIRRIFGEPLR
jgi:hypothetical protein